MRNLVQFIGGVMILSAVMTAGISLLGNTTVIIDKHSLAFMLVLQIIIGASLIYASIQKAKGDPIAVKLYPSSIGAAVLFFLIAYRWIRQGA